MLPAARFPPQRPRRAPPRIPMSPPYAARLAAAALVCMASSAAQVVDSIRPAILAPGALVRVEGRGLAAVHTVRFLALGPGDQLLLVTQPVLRAEDGELRVVVPAFADEPTRATPESPWAWIAVDGAAARPVFLLEATQGRVRLAGAGSQRPDGERLAIAFDLAGGPPNPGNAGFALELHGAPPRAAAFVLAGLAAAPPLLRVRDAAVGVDLSVGYVLLGPIVTDADGVTRTAMPVPALAGLTFAAQWLLTAHGLPLLSDALVVEL